jgi:hypothetical protein
MKSIVRLTLVVVILTTSTLLSGPTATSANEEPWPVVETSGNNFVGTSHSKKVVSGSSERGAFNRSNEAEPVVLPVDDGIEYAYERSCTAGVEALDPATCPRVDAVCAAQEDGILVNWIAVDTRVQPATRTPTGRTSCTYPGEPPVAPVEAGFVPAEAPVVITLEEFQKQPVLAATILSQPANFGLRNAHSNMWAQAAEQEFAFVFQDADIVLKARPVAYLWEYGDGTTVRTTSPGGPVPGNGFDTQTPTSHRYAETGDFQVAVTTFFAGDYSLDGGPFQPVAGEAAVVSAPHLMSIWRTQGHQVSQDCLENPTGVGCQPPTR